MKKSLIICTRNRSDSLRRCLQRVEKMNYSGALEIVIVNNESVDATEAVAREYSRLSRFDVKMVECKKNWFGSSQKLWHR